jgi:hypothetical protein
MVTRKELKQMFTKKELSEMGIQLLKFKCDCCRKTVKFISIDVGTCPPQLLKVINYEVSESD